MVFGEVGGNAYNIVFILHILAVVCALAPAIAHPIMARQAKQLDPGARNTVYGFLAFNSQRVYGSALILAGVFGFGLVGMSDDVYEMSQGWLITSIIIWVAMIGILHALLVPAERALAAGDPGAESKVGALGGVMTLLALVMFYLMVFKPGL